MSSSYFGIFAAVASAGIVVKIVLLILLVLSIYSWSVILNKYKNINQKNRLVAKLRKIVKQDKADFHKIVSEFSAISNNPYLNIVKFLESNQKILIVQDNVNQMVSDSVYNFLYDINLPLENKLPSLATIGNSAPFIGLFGTVIGIINSFSTIGETSSASLAVIAPGIAEALYATAFGLFVAIPASFGYNYFANKLDGYKEQQSILIQELIVYFIKQQAIKQPETKTAETSFAKNSQQIKEGYTEETDSKEVEEVKQMFARKSKTKKQDN
ncbi:MotA/TolQ/ExbB proton channel family protein [Rickettsiales bacterium LUAb2]